MKACETIVGKKYVRIGQEQVFTRLERNNSLYDSNGKLVDFVPFADENFNLVLFKGQRDGFQLQKMHYKELEPGDTFQFSTNNQAMLKLHDGYLNLKTFVVTLGLPTVLNIKYLRRFHEQSTSS